MSFVAVGWFLVLGYAHFEHKCHFAVGWHSGISAWMIGSIFLVFHDRSWN